jgi:flagellin
MSIIGTNIGALNASNYLTQNNEMLTKSIKKLASGSRLADPVDDAAGVAVSGNLDARVKRLVAAVEGSQNIVSFAQTADGFLSTLQSIVTRMSELAQRATNGAFSTADRANYNTEYTNLQTQYSRVVANANFNGQALFTGATDITVAIDASANTDVLSSAYATAASSAITGVVTIATTANALTAVTALTASIASITTARAQVNSDISKFNFYIQNIRTENVNVQAANSRIKDLNVADESTQLSKNNILVQAATAMLAQANSSQQSVLSLLQ